MDFQPAYKYLTSDDWQNRLSMSKSILSTCSMCPRKCGVNRLIDEKGLCNSGYLPEISCITTHFGEEPVISGKKGTGNIFFSHCNLNCIYCQNYEISQNLDNRLNRIFSTDELADKMLELQNQGVHNIGLVSPTHFALQLLPAIKLASDKGLKIPIVYNSNGYDSVETLRLFEGVIDIYLPDLKYGSDVNGNFSGVTNYFTKAKAAISEMYRQLGNNLYLENEIAVRGLIIRHLVLPNNIAETRNVFEFIAENLSSKIHISLMSQYYPARLAKEYEKLNRTLTDAEYTKAAAYYDEFHFENGWLQSADSNQSYRPEFSDLNNTFNFKRDDNA